jgi:hypothetical protein
MPNRNQQPPRTEPEAAERRPPEEPAPARSAAPDDDVPVVQLGEDPGTVDPEAD